MLKAYYTKKCLLRLYAHFSMTPADIRKRLRFVGSFDDRSVCRKTTYFIDATLRDWIAAQRIGLFPVLPRITEGE